jgi:membrane protease YdiL (CAAX protease family)
VSRLILGLLAVAGVSIGFGMANRGILKPQLTTLGFGSRYFYLGLAVLAGLLVINFTWSHFIWSLASDDMKKETLGDVMKLVPTLIGRVVMICGMPAIFEEIGFRGLAQTWLMRVISPWKAVIVSAIFFSAAHLSVLGGPYLLMVGALLGWVRWRTGSLYPGMVLHFLHNLAVLWYDDLLS